MRRCGRPRAIMVWIVLTLTPRRSAASLTVRSSARSCCGPLGQLGAVLPHLTYSERPLAQAAGGATMGTR